MFYLDAVLDDDHNVLSFGTPKDTAEWLRQKMTEEDCSSWIVMTGVSLRSMTIDTYLKA
jgi:hypothetical protein